LRSGAVNAKEREEEEKEKVKQKVGVEERRKG
jgi:hypothetical protein